MDLQWSFFIMAKNVRAIYSSLPFRTKYAIHEAFINILIPAAKEAEHCADDEILLY